MVLDEGDQALFDQRLGYSRLGGRQGQQGMAVPDELLWAGIDPSWEIFTARDFLMPC